MIPDPAVERFVRMYFERKSTALVAEEPGVFHAELPPALRKAFGGADAIRIAFDPALAAGRAGVELAVVGSYVVDRLVEDAVRSGRHSVARFPAGADVAATAPDSLSPRNAVATLESSSATPVLHYLFTFRVRLTTDERVERLESVLIDSRTAGERPCGPPLFEEAGGPPPSIPASTGLPEAYRAACRVLEGRIESQVAEFRAAADRLLEAELARIGSYFDRSVREAAGSRSATARDEARAFELERERRLAEAREKYGFTGEVELCAVRTVLLDVVVANVALENRGVRRIVPVEVDAVNPRPAVPRCEGCGTPAPGPFLCFGGHLVGPECAKGCGFCDRVHCRACAADGLAIVSCTVCGRPACPDHVEVDALGGQPFCPDDIVACAICGRTVGPAHVRRCGLCEQTYCAVCVAPPAEKCLTCRSLEPAPAGDPDVAVLRKGDPELARIARWRRGANQRYRVLVARGLVWSQLFVVDRAGQLLVRKKVLGA